MNWIFEQEKMSILRIAATLGKIGVVSTFVFVFVLFNFYFFLERSPPANTAHLDEMQSAIPKNDLRFLSIYDPSSIKASKKKTQGQVLRKIAFDEIGTINSTASTTEGRLY